MKPFDIRCIQEGSNTKPKEYEKMPTNKRSRRGQGNTIHIPQGKYTAASLAKLVGISKDTIDRWRRLGLLPYDAIPAGKLTVYVFGEDAIVKARQMAGKTGKLSDRNVAA